MALGGGSPCRIMQGTLLNLRCVTSLAHKLLRGKIVRMSSDLERCDPSHGISVYLFAKGKWLRILLMLNPSFTFEGIASDLSSVLK